MPAASKTLALVLAALTVLAAVAACGGSSPQRQATVPARHVNTNRPSASASPTPRATPPPPTGVAGSYRVGQKQMTFTEPAHTGVTGQYLAQRKLLTTIRYPLAPSSSKPASGPFPLLLFGPGFKVCASPYSHLLQTWASAGYVVAAVNFPRTSCLLGDAADEADLVNQPGDMSYVLSRVLELSAATHGLLAGLVNPLKIGAAGQSDGGDTVAALAANKCCMDRRVEAVAVLAGAEWPPMPGPYFAHGAPPMLYVQGSADTTNPPGESLKLYRADSLQARYYLDLFGEEHLGPYEGDNSVERLVGRVTLAFFDTYLLGQGGAAATMKRDGNVHGTAALVSGGTLPP